MKRAMAMACWLGVACAASEAGEEESGTTDGAASCEPGTYSACACADGQMGMQQCAPDGLGLEACVCGAEGSSTGGGEGEGSEDDGVADAGTGTGMGSGADMDTGTGMGTGSSNGTTDSGGAAQVPVVEINHPSDGEERVVGEEIPFIGAASDLEDGPLSGAAMTWASDLEGAIGEGVQFEAALTVAGVHVITLAATDTDGNVAQASITLVLVDP